MRQLFWTVLFLCVNVSFSHAAVIYLTSGASIEGEILEKTDNHIRVDMNGIELTYYMDEIEKIEGFVLDGAAQTAKTAPDPKPTLPKEVKNDSKKISSYARMSKEALIFKFMEVFGTEETMRESFKVMLKNYTPEQAHKIQRSITVDGIMRHLIPLYDKHFTRKELIAYIEFYSSQDGAKLLTTIPLLMQESVEHTVAYLQQALPEDL